MANIIIVKPYFYCYNLLLHYFRKEVRVLTFSLKKILSFEFGISLILIATIWGMSSPEGIGIVYIFLLGYFGLLLAKKKIVIRSNPFLIWFFLTMFFYMWGLLATTGSPFEYRVVKSDLYVIMWSILFMFILWGGINERNLERFVQINKKITVCVMFALSLVGLFKYYSLLKGVYYPTFYFDGRYAYGSVLSSDMSMFSLCMIIALVMCLSLFYRAKTTFQRFVYLIPITTLTLTVFLSGSRRGFILTIILFFIAGLIAIKNSINRKKVVRVIIFLYFAIFIGLIVYTVDIFTGLNLFNLTELSNVNQFKYAISRFLTISPDQIGESFSSRSVRWELAFDLIKESSVFNIVFGSGFDYIGDYRALTIDSIDDYPHNFFVSSLLYSGLLGTVFLFLMVIRTFKTLFKYRKIIDFHLILVYLTTFSFMSLSGNSIFSYKLFVFLTILINFLPYIKRKIIV